MITRIALAVCTLSFVAGCFSGMQTDIRPPECTVDERSADCRTAPSAPSSMTEEDFFQDESSLIQYWTPMA